LTQKPLKFSNHFVFAIRLSNLIFLIFKTKEIETAKRKISL